jgi:hypothetical protein
MEQKQQLLKENDILRKRLEDNAKNIRDLVEQHQQLRDQLCKVETQKVR